jgi:biotin carboxyl carrier protein
MNAGQGKPGDVARRGSTIMRRKKGCYASLLVLMLCLSPFLLRDAGAREMPPPVVTVMAVTDQQVNPAETYVGRMEAIQAVDLRARVQGYLEAVKFKEGAQVRAGDVLYIIEQAPYKADLDEESAKVDEARASLKDAQQYLKRLKRCNRGVSPPRTWKPQPIRRCGPTPCWKRPKPILNRPGSSWDTPPSRRPSTAKSGERFHQGKFRGPRIRGAGPNRSTGSHSCGLRHQRRTSWNASTPNGDTAKTSAVKKCPPVFMIQMPGGAVYPQEGYLDFIDNQVDPNTGTIAVRAVFENPQRFSAPRRLCDRTGEM